MIWILDIGNDCIIRIVSRQMAYKCIHTALGLYLVHEQGAPAPRMVLPYEAYPLDNLGVAFATIFQ